MKRNKTTYSSKKFLISMIISTIVILIVIGSLTYTVDPFLKYRYKPDKMYLLNPRFVNPGLLKNYDYNTVILGSSMVQNFDMNLFRADPSVKPLKIAIGAASRDEIEVAYSLIKKEKTKSIIVNLDLTSFNALSKDVKYPSYTYKDDLLSQLGYLYSYEACIRYMPIDIGSLLFSDINQDMHKMMKEKSDVDRIGEFRGNNNYQGKIYFLRFLYKTGSGFSYQDTEDMDKRMKEHFDQFIAKFDIGNNKHIEYTFILPPYSIAYWGYTDQKGYYQNFVDIVRYINKQVSKYENVRLICFYDIDTIMDLNSYADLTHFNPETSDFIVNNLFTEKYRLTHENIDIRIQKLDSMVSVFNTEYADWNE